MRSGQTLPEYRLSNKARADLKEIARYTFKNWGIDQARRYNDGLLKRFQTIAESPLIGRRCDEIQAGYRRMEHARHVVFYRQDGNGVLISRILHQRMMPGQQAFADSPS